MDVALQPPWTPERFLTWVEAQEEPYEFDGEQPVLMTRSNNNHSIIIRNLIILLSAGLNGGPCQALGPEAGVATVGNAIRYPDLLITCSPIDGVARTVPGVVAAFEVVSPTSGHNDRVVKVREYAAVPTMRRYALVESASIGVLARHRATQDDPWTETPLTEHDALDLPEFALKIRVADIYRRVIFAD